MKKNCDYINVLFSFLTYKAPKEIKQIEGITIPIKINKEKIFFTTNGYIELESDEFNFVLKKND